MRSIICVLLCATQLFLSCEKESEMKVTYTIEVSNPNRYDIMVNGGGVCLDEGDRCKVIAAGESKSFTGKTENPGDEVSIYSVQMGLTVPDGYSAKFYPVSGGKYSWIAGRMRVKNETTGEYE